MAQATRPEKPNRLMIENAQLIFKNFQGAEDKYNREGDRNFAVLLDSDLAGVLAQDGWNVKRLRPRDDDPEADPEGQAYLQVKVSYKIKPPKITTLSTRGRTMVPEDLVDTLDWSDFSNVDLMIEPSVYEMRGEFGIAAYLKTMFATLDEDELEMKYAQMEIDAKGSSFQGDDEDQDGAPF